MAVGALLMVISVIFYRKLDQVVQEPLVCCRPLGTGGFPEKPFSLSRRLWKLVLGLTSMPFCALAAVILLTYQRHDSPAVNSLSIRQGLVIPPFVLFPSVMLLLAILILADYEHLTQEKRLASLREICYQDIQRERIQVRTLRHDLRSHLTVLQDLVESGKTEKAEDYVEQILLTPALRCQADKGMLMLKVTNALAGDEREGLTAMKADQKRHGFGLAGMGEIARRYGGTMETEAGFVGKVPRRGCTRNTSSSSCRNSAGAAACRVHVVDGTAFLVAAIF